MCSAPPTNTIPATLLPLFPAGYASLSAGLPQRRPRSGGPHSGRRAAGGDPEALEETLIGPQTAREIGLLR
jgi:hypothetical protein